MTSQQGPGRELGADVSTSVGGAAGPDVSTSVGGAVGPDVSTSVGGAVGPDMSTSVGGVTWRSLIAEMAARFSAASVAHPELSARRIAEEASGYRPSELECKLHEHLTKRMVVAADSMALRRLNHEPLQYVVGSWGFRSLDLMVDRRVLIPRPETEEVAGWALEEVDRLLAGGTTDGRRLRVADLGTGSGAIGLSIAAERTDTEVTLTDVDRDALVVARANTIGLGRPAERVVGVLEGEWFAALGPVDQSSGFDVVVSNPPYVAESDELPAEVEDWEPAGALRADDGGFTHIEHLIEHCGMWLSGSDAALVIEMAPTQVERACQLAGQHFAEVEAKVDAFDRSRAIVARGNRSVWGSS